MKGYNLGIMRQTAYLVFIQKMVDSYVFLFNCTTMGQVSDSIVVPT